jgi:hypothetical protein
MKAMSILTAALVLALTGCSNEKKTVEGKGGEKLELTGPANTTIKQGETEKITVKVKRTKFDDAIDLDFKLPEGVTLEEKSTRIDKGSNDATFHLKADTKASPRDDEGTVVAKGGDLKTDPSKWKITIKKKD